MWMASRFTIDAGGEFNSLAETRVTENVLIVIVESSGKEVRVMISRQVSGQSFQMERRPSARRIKKYRNVA